MTLAFVGFAVTGVLVPWIARRWDDQRTAGRVRVDLVERVSSQVAALSAAIAYARFYGRAAQDSLDLAYRTWIVEKTAIGALLAAYYDGPDVARAWTRCAALTTAAYVRSGMPEANVDGYLDDVAAGLWLLDEPVDASEGLLTPSQREAIETARATGSDPRRRVLDDEGGMGRLIADELASVVRLAGRSRLRLS